MSDIVSDAQAEAARTIIRSMAEYRNSEDLINLGAYQPGSNVRLDAAIQMKEPIDRYLQQQREIGVGLAESCQNLETLAGQSLLVAKGAIDMNWTTLLLKFRKQVEDLAREEVVLAEWEKSQEITQRYELSHEMEMVVS